jgi:hypothetical protein
MEYVNYLDHEIRISTKSSIINTVSRVWEKLQNLDYVIFSGINKGISNLLLIVEICKVKFGPLHQVNRLETLEVCSVEDSANDKKLLTRFRVWLYKTKPEKFSAGTFYQSPYSKENINKLYYINKDTSDEEDNVLSRSISALNSTIVPQDNNDYHSSDFEIHSEEDEKKKAEKAIILDRKSLRKSLKKVKYKENKTIPGLKQKK